MMTKDKNKLQDYCLCASCGETMLVYDDEDECPRCGSGRIIVVGR